VDINPVPSSSPRDTVLEQDPLAGEKVDEGSTVTLSVSSGPQIVTIPEVQGLTEKQATQALEDEGLQVQLDFAFDDTVPEDRAIGTEPAVGTDLPSDSSVRLIMSRGSNKVEVPDVVGLDDQQALSILSDSDLGGNVVQRDDDAPAGQVVGQSPGPGRMVNAGAQVTIFVSSGAIVVPDVLGQARKQAVTAIKQAGFTPSVTEEPTADPAESNRVINQFPPSGSRGQRGDLVTITVGVLTP
jgi:serine/threonine-protein kinase